jgi:hypothetical protein
LNGVLQFGDQCCGGDHGSICAKKLDSFRILGI